MKVIIASSSDILRFFKQEGDKLINDTAFPLHTVHFIPDSDVDTFIKKKLQSGFQCVILRADQFAYNELIAKTISL